MPSTVIELKIYMYINKRRSLCKQGWKTSKICTIQNTKCSVRAFDSAYGHQGKRGGNT